MSLLANKGSKGNSSYTNTNAQGVMIAKSNNIGIETILGLPLLAIILGAAYSFATFSINFDPIIVGPVALMYLAVFLPAKFIVRKKKIRHYSKLVLVAVLAVLLAFMARFAMSGYMSYRDFVANEIQYEKEEGSFISEKDAEAIVNEYLQIETGYQGYLGAFTWDLQNTTIQSSRSSGSTQEIGFWGAMGLNIAELVISLLFVIFGLPDDLRKMAVFCEKCNEIKISKSFILGNFKSFEQLKKSIVEKDFGGLKALFKPTEAGKNDMTTVLVYQCSACGASADAQTEVEVIGMKNQQKKDGGKRVVYTQPEVKELLKVVEVSI